jgi:hypothetical protein
MKRSFITLGSVVLLVAVATSALAHHGRGSTYDTKREISVKGVVSQLSWRNPHVAIYIDQKDEASGKVTTWVIEHSNISQLARLGYGRNTVQVGMEVTAYFNPGSRGEPIGLCQKIILPDGKEVFQRDNLPANLRRGAAGLVID